MIVVLSKRKLAIKLVVKVLQNPAKTETERGRERARGGKRSCLHHQLPVESRAIKDTAVKAAHQINDNNSQKFLSRSLKKRATVRRNRFCLRKSQAKPRQKSKLAIGEDRRQRANVGHASRVWADDDDRNGERAGERESGGSVRA